jgi:DNA polymerase-4
LGAHTCADLRTWPRQDLEHHFGSFGARLYQLCRGIDTRAVCSEHERKSVSVEETYTPDVPDLPACLGLLPELFDSLLARIKRAAAEQQVQKLYVKLRFADFSQTTVECVASAPQLALFAKLLDTGFRRGHQPVRLLGCGVRLGAVANALQLSLFEQEVAAA